MLSLCAKFGQDLRVNIFKLFHFLEGKDKVGCCIRQRKTAQYITLLNLLQRNILRGIISASCIFRRTFRMEQKSEPVTVCSNSNVTYEPSCIIANFNGMKQPQCAASLVGGSQSWSTTNNAGGVVDFVNLQMHSESKIRHRYWRGSV